MTHLKLYSNGLDGAIPDLTGLANLEYLDLSYNSLSGEIPSSLYSLINLDRLYLNDNVLTGGVSSSIAELTQLTHIELQNNNLAGGIRFPQSPLQSINYSNNQFSQFSSPFGASFIDLQYVYLNDNLISGDLPSGLGLLPNIRQLNLANNQITGAIPEELFDLDNQELQWLDFSNNQFSSFPDIGDTLTAIYFSNLYLSDNNLTTLPESICNLPYNCYINVSNNNLCPEYNYSCIGNFNDQDCD